MCKVTESSNIVEQFCKNGVVFPLRVLSEEETVFFRNEFEMIAEVFNKPLWYMRDLHRHLEWAYDLSLHPKILDIISPLLNDEVCVLGSQILTKYPQTNNYVPWHQDAFKNEWNDSLTVWLALSESNTKNGCMQVIPATHLGLKQKHISSPDINNILSGYNFQIEKDFDENKVWNLELNPGEISIHHQNIIHRSKANNSSTKRIGFVLRYINPKFAKNTEVIYARGKKRYDFNTVIERPKMFRKKNNPIAYRTFLESRLF